MAALFLLQFLSVWEAHSAAEDPDYVNALLKIHSISGFAIFGLGCWRLGRRVKRRARFQAHNHTALVRLIAGVNHTSLYLMMMLQPTTGLLSSLPLEHAKLLGRFHAFGGIVILLLIALHTGAALWHHFVAQDDTLKRMLPLLKK